jgi:hypothetical protein
VLCLFLQVMTRSCLQESCCLPLLHAPAAAAAGAARSAAAAAVIGLGMGHSRLLLLRLGELAV